MRKYFYLTAKNEGIKRFFEACFAPFRVVRGQNFLIPSFLLAALSLTACFNPAPNNQTNQNSPAEIQVPASNINLARPLEISTRPEDVALARQNEIGPNGKFKIEET